MTVIEFAEKRLNESCLNDDDEAVLYWRAYLDGARAQKKEYINGMDKCTGMRCPMQAGCKVYECNYKVCPYRTEPMTNADRIREMSDEELAWELMIWRCETSAKYHGVESQYPDTQQAILSWLQQPVKEENNELR